MTNLDNIKLTELSTEEKMNVNGGGLFPIPPIGMIILVVDAVASFAKGAAESVKKNCDCK